MPKISKYETGAIIYFTGDPSSEIFLLKSGIVQLEYNDIETGKPMRDIIKPGEFFGVKSVLGSYAHEETATALQVTEIFGFSSEEFEKMVNNSRILMKMLRVFSSQLRNVNAKVKHLLGVEEQIDQEKALFNVAEKYRRFKRWAQAVQIYKRFLSFYPGSSMTESAKKAMVEIEDNYLSSSS